MRVALYARVSTLNGQHPEMQLSELREYGARRGWQIISEYVDEGVSGTRERRPQLDRLMADAHRRKFDLIAVWKVDRFGRSLKHLVNALADLSRFSWGGVRQSQGQHRSQHTVRAADVSNYWGDG
jgi:DNA invertase Pin-like site-specific DNA recombinase